jgi:hypothetical protein
MNDENKDKSDLHEDEMDHDEFDDSFDDAFELDEASEQDALTPEEIEAHAAAPKEESTTERPVKKSGSLLPLVIGLAVFGFIGWKLYGAFVGKKSVETAQNVPAVTPNPKEPPTELATVKAAPPPPPPVQTAPSEPSTLTPLVPAQPAEDLMNPAKTANEISKETQSDLTKLQARLEELEKAHKQKLEAIEKEIALTNENTTNASRALSNIQRDISMLTTTVQQLGSRFTTIQQDEERKEIRRQQATTRKKSKPAPKADSLPSLTVYAIIPGRAWLRSANGKTISVTEGEPIAEYGTVLKIDASNGVVITTSGVTLR